MTNLDTDRIVALESENARLKATLENAIRLLSNDPDGDIDWGNAERLLISWCVGVQCTASHFADAASKLRGMCRLCLIMCRNRGPMAEMTKQLEYILEETKGVAP